jgi:acylphosphatase
VELLVEGATDRVERLLHSLEQSFPGNIESRTVEELNLPEQFDSFEVRR